MRIDRLTVRNFKKFAEQTFELHPQFTLLVGDNGSGKTSVLDALAISLGIWLVDKPDSTLQNSGRNILQKEIRLESEKPGDRIRFRERKPTEVEATGLIGGRAVSWMRQIREGGTRTTNANAAEAREIIQDLYKRDGRGENLLLPVLAYYGAGRGWLPSNERIGEPRTNGPARRWAAFHDCLNERIRFSDLRKWFQRETTAAGNQGGRMRPGFEAVKRAVLGCVPEADALWFDSDREQIVLSIKGNAQPIDNLSAGQRMMLALVADIAIKAVSHNDFLLASDELGPEDEPLPRVLTQTPGVVLIDELDVHLHPTWQRRVASDLKRTFPAMQFVCTSHSPQVIGELAPDEIRVLDGDTVSIPSRTFGIDSSRILEEVMETAERNEAVSATLKDLSRLIDEENLEKARQVLSRLETQLGPDDPEVLHAGALVSFLEDTP